MDTHNARISTGFYRQMLMLCPRYYLTKNDHTLDAPGHRNARSDAKSQKTL